MSRAFVRESDTEQPSDLPPLVSPLPPGAKNYLTRDGVQRLRQEIAQQTETRRPALVAAPVADTEAKRELQVLDQRLRYLQDSLRTAEVVAPPTGPADVVHFGATVTVREEGDTEARYRIVGVDETDLNRNWVSWLSPIARALLNARIGQRVTLQTPRGKKELEITRIEYEG